MFKSKISNCISSLFKKSDKKPIEQPIHSPVANINQKSDFGCKVSDLILGELNEGSKRELHEMIVQNIKAFDVCREKKQETEPEFIHINKKDAECRTQNSIPIGATVWIQSVNGVKLKKELDRKSTVELIYCGINDDFVVIKQRKTNSENSDIFEYPPLFIPKISIVAMGIGDGDV